MALAAAGAAFIIAACVAARTASATRPEMSSEELRVSAGPAANDQDFGGDDVLHATRGPPDFLYVIGDSHGDKNYLVRSLLATEVFKLKGTELQWTDAPNKNKAKSREVVILGDFVDRGTFSKDNAELLKTFEEDTKKPERTKFTVLMGNHESMLLRGVHKYAGMTGTKGGTDWSAEDRDAAIKAKDGEGDAAIIKWMRKLPVVHLVNGALLMHGGLSKAVTAKLLKEPKLKECKKEGPDCGQAAMGYINTEAARFYEELHECRQKGQTAAACEGQHHQPYFLADEKGTDGVLWYRGYSKTGEGAGKEPASREANDVAGQFGAQVMVVAHSTHERITKYPPPKGGFCMVPVYAVDTHYTDCMNTGECDFGTTKKHQFHDGTIDTAKKNVPQALKLQCTMMTSRAWQISDYRCLSMVDNKVTVKCESGLTAFPVAPQTEKPETDKDKKCT